MKNFKSKTVCRVPEGYDAFWLAELARAEKGADLLYILADGRQTAQVADILAYAAPGVQVLKLPAWDSVPYDRVSPNPAIEAERIATLAALARRPVLDGRSKGRVVLAGVSAVMRRLPPKKVFLNSIREIFLNNKLNLDNFIHYVSLNGYVRAEQVVEVGEYAVRGDIIDIFPQGSEVPLRIDLFGDEVERIRTFDPGSQRTTGDLPGYEFQAMSEAPLSPAAIKAFRENYREAFGAGANTDALYEAVSAGRKYPGMENWLALFYEESLPSLFDYLPEASVFIGKNVVAAMKAEEDVIVDHYRARLEGVAGKEEVYRPVKPEKMFLTALEAERILMARGAAKLYPFALPADENTVDLGVAPGKDFSRLDSNKYKGLIEYIKLNTEDIVAVCCYSEGSRERMRSLLAEYGGQEIKDRSLSHCERSEAIHLGAGVKEMDCFVRLRLPRNDAFLPTVSADSFAEWRKGAVNLAVLNLAHGFVGGGLKVVSEQDVWGERITSRRPVKKSKIDNFISDISSLSPGELVVHAEHGVGRFLGLENVVAGGAPHDCLKILYANDAKLFVPVENIEAVSRYGLEDEGIALDTLGGAAWGTRKERVRKKIRDIAEGLIKIAAERETKAAEKFAPPEGLYGEFCARFPYTETDDQLNAISDVFEDLGKGSPMDRLVCGDVGFGKTEVALRAAFAVASSGAQVAVVAPTTLLARQHYHNFKKRFEGFPIKIRMLSRLVSAREAKEAKEELASGAVEVVIGTHALLAKDISFCNLGLLIVDEEQHFGVSHKEKLKAMKSDVHVLTLTATPIPRTLQLSLAGVKQLSVIATPPADRLAVRSFVMPFDRLIIREAIYREKFRGGQTFVVCPRVSDIPGILDSLRKMAPDVRVLAAHGQMAAGRLEEVMNEFAEGQADILVSTSIIESGIDLPTVNTMIIHRADMFGLAQLYQLKGRIGRSKARGYCYFTVPHGAALKPVAEKRLTVLQSLDALGSGFSLASYDMDIRGSGNILGEEQSGHIKEVGVSLYQHMLAEEVERLRSGAAMEREEKFVPAISTGIPILIPESYVPDLGVRLGLYKRIGGISSAAELADMREELADRFGKIPAEVDNLLASAAIKHLCLAANVEKVEAGAKGILLSFHKNEFAAADKLVDFAARSFGAVKIRPDMKLFAEGELSGYAERAAAVKKLLTTLSGMLQKQ